MMLQSLSQFHIFMHKGVIIAIDGPVASGKGTLANHLAKSLSGFDLYTGATYRCLALYALEHNIAVTDVEALSNAIKNTSITFQNGSVLLNGKDVTKRIQEPDIAQGASKISVYPEIRALMVQLQREIAHEFINKGKIVVAEGRDTATVVFPDADLKVYVTASVEIRAKRRLSQYLTSGDKRDLGHVLSEITTRDERDMKRLADPLSQKPEQLGYFVIDSSDKNEAETLQMILSELHTRRILND